MPIWFRGRYLGIHPAALKHRTEEDIVRVIGTSIRVDTEEAHGRRDIVAVAGWDMGGMPTVVLINTRRGLIFHANKPCDAFAYMFTP